MMCHPILICCISRRLKECFHIFGRDLTKFVLTVCSQEIRGEYRRVGGPVGAEHLPAGHQGLPGTRRRGLGEQEEASLLYSILFLSERLRDRTSTYNSGLKRRLAVIWLLYS